jgi:putative transposase
MDNVFIERLWRSLNYECVFETGGEARNGTGSWIDYDDERRPHATFGGRTPDEVYAAAEMTEQLAA